MLRTSQPGSKILRSSKREFTVFHLSSFSICSSKAHLEHHVYEEGDLPHNISSFSICSSKAHLEHHVYKQGGLFLSRKLSSHVGRRQVKEICACLVANDVRQHLFANTMRSGKKHRLDVWCLLMNSLRTCEEGIEESRDQGDKQTRWRGI